MNRVHRTEHSRTGTQEDRSTEDLVPALRTDSRITETRTARMVPTTAASRTTSITETRTSTQIRTNSTITTRDMART